MADADVPQLSRSDLAKIVDESLPGFQLVDEPISDGRIVADAAKPALESKRLSLIQKHGPPLDRSVLVAVQVAPKSAADGAEPFRKTVIINKLTRKVESAQG